jgi:hypothetical protein
MADITVSTDVDTMLQSANNAAIRSNIGAASSAGGTITGVLNCEQPIITGEIQSGSEFDEILNIDFKQLFFRDFDETPNTLMVIKKFDGYTGSRIGINKDPASSETVALQIHAGKNNSTNEYDDALKVVGGAFFENWVRLGHYTDTERDNLPRPTNGTVIYNSEHHEFQGYVGGGTGWVKFNTSAVS